MQVVVRVMNREGGVILVEAILLLTTAALLVLHGMPVYSVLTLCLYSLWRSRHNDRPTCDCCPKILATTVLPKDPVISFNKVSNPRGPLLRGVSCETSSDIPDYSCNEANAELSHEDRGEGRCGELPTETIKPPDWMSCQWVSSPVPVTNSIQLGIDPVNGYVRPIDFEKLESAIGHKFNDRSLLVEAVTHASSLPIDMRCYQRLEFVGDAVLDHLITRYFFMNYRELPPGRLTDLRQATVNNENFARVSVKNNFHTYLQHGSAGLEAKINDFAENIRDELDKPGLNSFGLGDIKAPKVLGDILESIAGAVFLDAGLDCERVWQVFEPLLQPIVTPQTLMRQPVSELQERCQQLADDLEYNSIQMDDNYVVEVLVNGELIATATNAKKKVAQKQAARNALSVLKQRDSNIEAAAAAGGDEDEKIDGGDGEQRQAFHQDTLGVYRNGKQTLYQICMTQKWPKPEYKLIKETGHRHAKKYAYSVRVLQKNGWSSWFVGLQMPSVKTAKDSAAVTLMQHLRRSK